MKISYSAEFEPKDIVDLFDAGMTIANKIMGLYNEETQKTETQEIKEKVGHIDTKIDGLEAQIKDFREVITKASPKK